MRKIKATMLVIVLAGLTGCSTDDSKDSESDLMSCEYTPKSSWNYREIFKETRLCMETSFVDFSISNYDKNCEEVEGKLSNGCPSGSVKVCGYPKGKMYFYDEKFKGMTCDEIISEPDES